MKNIYLIVGKNSIADLLQQCILLKYLTGEFVGMQFQSLRPIPGLFNYGLEFLS